MFINYNFEYFNSLIFKIENIKPFLYNPKGPEMIFRQLYFI